MSDVPDRLYTVVETPSFLSSAKHEGMSEAERVVAVNIVAADPTHGDLISGSGGCRKFRVAGHGRGKSGGYRVMSAYVGDALPVYLLFVLAKGSRANFSKAEVAEMHEFIKTLKAAGDRQRRDR